MPSLSWHARPACKTDVSEILASGSLDIPADVIAPAVPPAAVEPPSAPQPPGLLPGLQSLLRMHPAPVGHSTNHTQHMFTVVFYMVSITTAGSMVCQGHAGQLAFPSSLSSISQQSEY